ncbi:phospholipase C/P1 nuclease domain-containing protein [Russula dissimulans]|nr:phospholipase C/P1 nuclease domain-containing protein [Russula dissimulans]
MRAFTTAAVVGLASLPSVIAWGTAGHEIVATIAQSHLTPKTLNAVCSILNPDGGDGSGDQVRGPAPCYLAAVATWADKIRFHARWSAPLHFINALGDHPPDNCVFPGPRGWGGRERHNVLDAIQNVSSILTDLVNGSLSPATTVGAPELAQEALKFLIHFVGDMHQPLHLSGRDRGGNSDKVHWDRRVTNLHSVWDNALIAKAIRTTPANYTRPTRSPTLEAALRGAIYDPYVRRIVWEGLGVGRGKGRWSSESTSWLTCPPAPQTETVHTPSSAAAAAAPPQEVLAAPTPHSASGPPATSDSDTLCPYEWASPIYALNCEIVWPAGLDNPEFSTHDDFTAADDNDELCGEDADGIACGRAPRRQYLELDTPEYSGKIAQDWIVEKLLAQGGWRLAGILNSIFSPGSA